MTELTLNDCALEKLDVGKFAKLQSVNVSRNRLSCIDGLQIVSELRCLDASGNPSFRVKNTLKQMRTFSKLEQVAVARSPSHLESGHIRAVLDALIPRNDKLAVVEGANGLRDGLRGNLFPGRAIDFLERMRCLHRIFRRRKDVDLERYRTQLALLQCATGFMGRNYSFAESQPGRQ